MYKPTIDKIKWLKTFLRDDSINPSGFEQVLWSINNENTIKYKIKNNLGGNCTAIPQKRYQKRYEYRFKTKYKYLFSCERSGYVSTHGRLDNFNIGLDNELDISDQKFWHTNNKRNNAEYEFMPKVLINKEHTNVLIKEVVAKKRFELGTQNTCIKARPYSTVPKSQSHEYYQSHVRLQEQTQILKDACDEPPKNVPFMSKNKSSHGRLDRDLETIKRYIYSGSSMNNGEFGQDRGITTEKHTAGDMHTKRTITGELPIEIHRGELELGYHNLVYLLDPKLRKKNNKTNLTNSKDGDKSDNIITLLKQLGDVNNDLETAVSVLESAVKSFLFIDNQQILDIMNRLIVEGKNGGSISIVKRYLRIFEKQQQQQQIQQRNRGSKEKRTSVEQVIKLLESVIERFKYTGSNNRRVIGKFGLILINQESEGKLGDFIYRNSAKDAETHSYYDFLERIKQYTLQNAGCSRNENSFELRYIKMVILMLGYHGNTNTIKNLDNALVGIKIDDGLLACIKMAKYYTFQDLESLDYNLQDDQMNRFITLENSSSISRIDNNYYPTSEVYFSNNNENFADDELTKRIKVAQILGYSELGRYEIAHQLLSKLKLQNKYRAKFKDHQQPIVNIEQMMLEYEMLSASIKVCIETKVFSENFHSSGSIKAQTELTKDNMKIHNTTLQADYKKTINTSDGNGDGYSSFVINRLVNILHENINRVLLLPNPVTNNIAKNDTHGALFEDLKVKYNEFVAHAMLFRNIYKPNPHSNAFGENHDSNDILPRLKLASFSSVEEYTACLYAIGLSNTGNYYRRRMAIKVLTVLFGNLQHQTIAKAGNTLFVPALISCFPTQFLSRQKINNASLFEPSVTQLMFGGNGLPFNTGFYLINSVISRAFMNAGAKKIVSTNLKFTIMELWNLVLSANNSLAQTKLINFVENVFHLNKSTTSSSQHIANTKAHFYNNNNTNGINTSVYLVKHLLFMATKLNSCSIAFYISTTLFNEVIRNNELFYSNKSIIVGLLNCCYKTMLLSIENKDMNTSQIKIDNNNENSGDQVKVLTMEIYSEVVNIVNSYPHLSTDAVVLQAILRFSFVAACQPLKHDDSESKANALMAQRIRNNLFRYLFIKNNVYPSRSTVLAITQYYSHLCSLTISDTTTSTDYMSVIFDCFYILQYYYYYYYYHMIKYNSQKPTTNTNPDIDNNADLSSGVSTPMQYILSSIHNIITSYFIKVETNLHSNTNYTSNGNTESHQIECFGDLFDTSQFSFLSTPPHANTTVSGIVDNEGIETNQYTNKYQILNIHDLLVIIDLTKILVSFIKTNKSIANENKTVTTAITESVISEVQHLLDYCLNLINYNFLQKTQKPKPNVATICYLK